MVVQVMERSAKTQIIPVKSLLSYAVPRNLTSSNNAPYWKKKSKFNIFKVLSYSTQAGKKGTSSFHRSLSQGRL